MIKVKGELEQSNPVTITMKVWITLPEKEWRLAEVPTLGEGNIERTVEECYLKVLTQCEQLSKQMGIRTDIIVSDVFC